MNLDYEYSIFTGQRKRTRVFPVCSHSVSVKGFDSQRHAASFTWDAVGAPWLSLQCSF
jgi:hypothetical protein